MLTFQSLMSDDDKSKKTSNGAPGADGPYSLGVDGDHLVVSELNASRLLEVDLDSLT